MTIQLLWWSGNNFNNDFFKKNINTAVSDHITHLACTNSSGGKVLVSHFVGVFSHWQGDDITHPEASSALPPPSSAPVWVVEQTPPLRRQWPGSTDPKPHRSPQTRLRLSSSPEKEESFHQPTVWLWRKISSWLGHYSVISLSYHFPSVSDHVCHWQDVCVLSSPTHPESSQLQPAPGISDASTPLKTWNRF